MSYREKSALVTLIALVLTAAAYAALALRHPLQNPFAAGAGAVAAMVMFTGIMILSQIALVIALGPKEARRPADERDRLVMLASRRNAGWVGVAGLWVVMYFAVTSSRLSVALLALGLFVLSELVLYASQLVYYRRGV
jgi:hypothetical protein